MLRIFLKLISVVFLISCSDSEEEQNTEIITDSYFFQKKIFNMNLYNCDNSIENLNPSYKKTSDSLNFYKFSELTGQDNQIDGCTQIYTQINELTPLKSDLLLADTYMELSNCNSKVEEDMLFETLGSYLEYLKDNNVQVWTGISKIEDGNFYWLNIWKSENYREQFLSEWLNSANSGKFAKALSSIAVCQNPSTYLFL